MVGRATITYIQMMADLHTTQRGGDGSDTIRVDARDGDNVVRIEAGRSTDSITHNVSPVKDTI